MKHDVDRATRNQSKMRTLVIGDVHGAYKALVQTLERAKYDPSNDTLLFLGDVADGWPETKECFDFIVEQKTNYNNVKYHLGNHDEWLLWWALNGGWPEDIWWSQGGKATVLSYHPELNTQWLALHASKPRIPQEHIDLLGTAALYSVDNNRLFVHAGISPDIPIEEQTSEDLLWNMDWKGNRVLWSMAQYWNGKRDRLTDFDEIFIGHTSTWGYSQVPTKCCEIWNMDQGCRWHGKLSIMDVDNHEFFQSDLTSSLYPDEMGRR